MIDSLYKIFQDLELSWIDSSKEIINTQKYRDLLSIFPNLNSIFQDGREMDDEEFNRTIKHIFRVFKIFFLMKEESVFHDTLSPDSLKKISAKIRSQNIQNEYIIPLILMYHDIGRFSDKKNHPHQSYLVISKNKLLDQFELLEIEKLLISKIIQYHLLFATIYTGESTFFGVYSLLNDNEFIKLISHEKYREMFVDLLEFFTYIDILGYSYAKIYDHYLKYFDEINYKLKFLLQLWPNRETALKKALEFSYDWIEWRIAGALRIFQFVETKPYLTREFYFDKLKESINESNNKTIEDWETIKKKYLTHSCKVQIKYGLAFLMILAFGDFYRSRMTKDKTISYKLILFWILISKKIADKAKVGNNYIWNVYIEGFPHWSKWSELGKKGLEDNTLESIINNSIPIFNKERKEFNLSLDFKQIFE